MDTATVIAGLLAKRTEIQKTINNVEREARKQAADVNKQHPLATAPRRKVWKKSA